MKQIDLNLDNMQSVVEASLLEKAENELDFRNSELQIKKMNLLLNIKKANQADIKLQQEQQRINQEERRLALDEIHVKYNITSDMVRKSDKIQRAIGKTMIGIFPEQDKQVLKIMEASKQLSDLQG